MRNLKGRCRCYILSYKKNCKFIHFMTDYILYNWFWLHSKILIFFFLFFFILFITAQPCSFPGSPAHSAVEFSDESLESGTIATYTCERGFELLGPARRVCDNGQWSPDGIPFCGKHYDTN